VADFLLEQWRYLHTLVVGMTRDVSESKFLRYIATYLPYRRKAGYPIRKVVVDEDLFRVLKKEGFDILGEVDIELLSLDTYKEPWWIISMNDDK